MDKIHSKIVHGLRHVSHKEHPILSGTVKSVDEDKALISVLLTADDDDNPTEEILLSAVSGNLNGIILIPAVNSDVVVAQIDGPSTYTLVKTSTLDKVIVTIGNTKIEVNDGLIQMNGGNNGGMVILGNVVGKLNAIEKDLNTLKSAFSTWEVLSNDGGAKLKAAAAAWMDQQIILTQNSDIENTKIKQ